MIGYSVLHFSLNLEANKRLHFKMSQLSSNSVLGKKPTYILIFILIFLNISNLTSQSPIETPSPIELTTALNTAQKIVDTQSSSWGFVDLVSYCVESIQNGIKFAIGVKDHPREFYVVHIKDEKNPQNSKDVWRERGHEDKGDIPIIDGKLPDNSLVVNPHDPVTEYVSSPAAQANTPQGNATPGKDIPDVKGKSHGNNGSATKADENGEDIVNMPHKEFPTGETEPHDIPVKEKTTKQEPTHNGKSETDTQEQNSKIAKSTNPSPQSDTNSNSPLDDDDKAKSSPSADQSSHVIEKVVLQKKKVDQHERYNAQNSASNSSMEQNNSESQGFENYSAKKPPSTVSEIEANPQEYDTTSISNSPEHYAIGTAGRENTSLRSQMLSAPTSHSNPENLSEIMKSSVQPTHSSNGGIVDGSSEAPAFDANGLISMNACELEFERNLWETNPKFCEKFQSEEEFVAYVKENSGCSSQSDEPEHASNLSVSMNDCETKFEQEFCHSYPDYCSKEHYESEEQFIMFIKHYSGCPGEGEANASSADHAAAEDGSTQHQPEDFESDGNSNGHDDNDTSSSSQIEPTKPVETKKNASKKKTKSTKKTKKP